MQVVTIFCPYIDIKEIHKFSSLVEANNFLYKEGFVFDSYDDYEEVHCWKYDDYTSAVVHFEQD